MSERPYELVQTPAGTVARVRIRGRSVLASPLLNRGTAFTPEEREVYQADMRAYFLEAIARKRVEPGEDLISVLVEEDLSDDELSSLKEAAEAVRSKQGDVQNL